MIHSNVCQAIFQWNSLMYDPLWTPIFTFLFEFQCFEFTDFKQDYETGLVYNYTVCPFENITKSYEWETWSLKIYLGSWDGEMHVRKDNEMLAMYYNNGSTEFCADGNTTFASSTEIYFFCGWSNHIHSVNESNECRYSIMFSVNCRPSYRPIKSILKNKFSV